MPKITPPSPVRATSLLKSRLPLVLNPRLVTPPVDSVVVTAPPGPVQNGPVVNPRTPPPGTHGAALVRWVSTELADQERVRSASFWDSGYLLGLLMPNKDLLGFNDLKSLIERSGLGISHFTAQKYLMIARSFDRETARNTGSEKCYALTLYAKAVNRAGQAAQILADDDRIQGTDLPPQRATAKTISAAQLMAAARRIKNAGKEEKVPTAVQAERDKLSKDTAKTMRSLGFKSPNAKIVRHDGKQKIAVYLSFEDARALESTMLPSIAKLLAKLARKRPDVVQLLRATMPGLMLKRAAA